MAKVKRTIKGVGCALKHKIHLTPLIAISIRRQYLKRAKNTLQKPNTSFALNNRVLNI
jgi:hypothetical protein